MPISMCHGSRGKETLLPSCSAPPITPNPTPGFDWRAIRPVAVHWIVEGPRLLQPWGKVERPSHRGGSPQPQCPAPPRLQLLHPSRIQRGQPPAAWRCCTSTILPPVSGMYEKVSKIIDSKTKSSQDPFSCI